MFRKLSTCSLAFALAASVQAAQVTSSQSEDFTAQHTVAAAYYVQPFTDGNSIRDTNVDTKVTFEQFNPNAGQLQQVVIKFLDTNFDGSAMWSHNEHAAHGTISEATIKLGPLSKKIESNLYFDDVNTPIPEHVYVYNVNKTGVLAQKTINVKNNSSMFVGTGTIDANVNLRLFIIGGPINFGKVALFFNMYNTAEYTGTISVDYIYETP
ncbi:hypothetical protein KS4_36480 [Poriferisphaera corsica]|uniref:Uncharacterized protein n=1 Tax=Poriferisphaera corsica TaxID=2528020 RepID=A0A517YZB0_9BACT|nr:hypothetical protein [Poriferisphaera corsica]QDU35565.1 hypothetical protein KS4_36480 [Poriferisphaera corsica]